VVDLPGESDVLKLLEVHEWVSLRDEPVSDAEESEHVATSSNNRQSKSRRDREYSPEDFWEDWNYSRPEPREVPVEATGSLAALASNVRTIAVPGDELAVLEPGSKSPAGTVQLKNDDETKSLLVAVVPRGKGEIVVVSDPEILANAHIARADNSVLAAQLLAPEGQPVDFDEYYHGLAVRGNPLYLLTRPGFAAMTTAILLVIGVVAWRAAVYLGPPLPDIERSRRDIQEYIHAMGAFFSRGRGHRRFLVREVREGVLHELCEELHLPPHTINVDTIASALARRHPDRAQAIRKALSDVDRQLAQSGEYPRPNFLSSMQRLAGCL
jgi:hypothetical protein